MIKVFSSWSGGKDCCLACYRAMKSGFKVEYLANMAHEGAKLSRTHGLSSDILKMQAQAMNIPIIIQPTSDERYEIEFKNMASGLKDKGVSGGVFGDMDVIEHRQWVERVCQDIGMKAYLPLWLENQQKLMKELVAAGFKAIVVATNAAKLGEEWLGRLIDVDFFEQMVELNKIKGISVCGEAGEYHSLVIDGPIFKKKLEIIESDTINRDNHWFLNIKEVRLVAK